MPSYEVSAVAAAPPDAVWPLLADLTRHGEWSADPLEVVADGAGFASVARAKGTEFRARLDVLESVPPTRFAFRAQDGTGTYEHVFTLVREGAGTRVTRRVTATSLSPAQRVLFYLVLPVIKKPNARKALDRFATLAAQR